MFFLVADTSPYDANFWTMVTGASALVTVIVSFIGGAIVIVSRLNWIGYRIETLESQQKELTHELKSLTALSGRLERAEKAIEDMSHAANEQFEALRTRLHEMSNAVHQQLIETLAAIVGKPSARHEDQK